MVLLRSISTALTAAMAALGSALFIALSFLYTRRVWSTHAEYCPISEEEEERGKRQVLVLGLDGAGKSSMLRSLTSGDSVARTGRCRPTRGFNFISLNVSAFQLDFLEEPPRNRMTKKVSLEGDQDQMTTRQKPKVGGGEDLRRYWLDYLGKSHILLFVVDSSDRPRLPLAKAELHRLLREEPQLPVVVLGNKQDKANAVSGSELHEALALHTVTADRKLFLLTSQLDSGAVRTSIQNLLLQLL